LACHFLRSEASVVAKKEPVFRKPGRASHRFAAQSSVYESNNYPDETEPLPAFSTRPTQQANFKTDSDPQRSRADRFLASVTERDRSRGDG